MLLFRFKQAGEGRTVYEICAWIVLALEINCNNYFGYSILWNLRFIDLQADKTKIRKKTAIIIAAVATVATGLAIVLLSQTPSLLNQIYCVYKKLSRFNCETALVLFIWLK